MNPDLDRLQPYPFQRLATLLGDCQAPAEVSAIDLSIGEPKHQPPGFIAAELIGHLHGLGSYPSTRGSRDLREAICDWLARRFALRQAALDPERHVLPVSGTREALFAIAQTIVERRREVLVAMPNPFYQIYEGAALLAGAEPYFLNCTAASGFLPDLDAVPDEVWDRCQLLYLCSPGNPSGSVADRATLARLIDLAHRHDFVIAGDECYSELYLDEEQPPPGLLGVAQEMGHEDFARCVAFHSLSKRSSVPGLRSGFVAGDPLVLERFLLYRTYHGCALPPATQAASAAAWREEEHVIGNRALYRAKFEAVSCMLEPVLEFELPPAGFYLWPATPIEDTKFARRLYAGYNVRLLPGSYLSRRAHGVNPGSKRVRIALVAPLEDCVQAAERIREFVANL